LEAASEPINVQKLSELVPAFCPIITLSLPPPPEYASLPIITLREVSKKPVNPALLPIITLSVVPPVLFLTFLKALLPIIILSLNVFVL
jgi:hypothetical protein